MPTATIGSPQTIALGAADALIVSCSAVDAVASVAGSTGFIGSPYELGRVVGEQGRRFGPYGRSVSLIVASLSGAITAEVSQPSRSPDAGDALSAAQAAAAQALVSDAWKRLKIVGRHYPMVSFPSATAGTDIGGTTRKTYVAAGAVSRMAALFSTHLVLSGAAGTTEDSTTVPRNINLFKVAFEYPLTGGKFTQVTRDGRVNIVVEPTSPLIMSDLVGFAVPAGGSFASRQYIKPALAPSGAGSAAAVAGGALAAQTWYYVVTRVEFGVESGPTTEINATTAASNLSVGITIVDTRSAAADCYRVYRSAAAAGTKQFVGQTNGPRKYFVDDGAVAVDTGITPPAVSNYRFNVLTTGAAESTSHINAGGVGDDQVQATGTFGITNGSFAYGAAPQVIVGDDYAGKSLLWTGDSVGGGTGFPQVGSGIIRQVLGMVDLAITNAGTYNSANFCLGGSSLAEMVAPLQQGGGRSRMLMLQFADWVIDQHGTNDLGYVADWTVLATNKLLLGRLTKAQGAKFATTTIPPRTVTTDGGITIANQTPNATHLAQRVLFNNWCRNGCQVDGSGSPVVSGGSPSPYVDGVIDICTGVEVNAANVLTPNGGYWKVLPTPVASGIAITSTGGTAATNPVLNFAADAAGAVRSKIGFVIKMTSGARSGETAVVASQSTNTALTLYGTGQTTTMSGVAVPTLTALPSNGDTFDVYDTLASEGLHPAITGHALLAVPITAWLQANVRGV